MNENLNTAGNKTSTGTKKLRKSKADKYILGVCGGISEYFDIDSTIVRVLWVVSIFIGGAGFVAYITAALLMPKPEVGVNEESDEEKKDKTGNLRYILGGILLVLGIVFMFDQIRYIALSGHSWNLLRLVHFPWDLIWPLALIALAIYIAVSGPKKDKVLRKIREKNLFRSVTNRKILGVCGGLGEYIGADPTLVRIIWILVTLLTGIVFGAIVYVIFALIMPERVITVEAVPEVTVQEKSKPEDTTQEDVGTDNTVQENDNPEDTAQQDDN